MMRTSFGGILLIVALFEVGAVEPESRATRMSSEQGRFFNPFSLNSWFNVPSQFLQYWFPLFQPAYRPPYLQKPKPSTPKPEVENQTEKGKDNIFGMSGPPGDGVETLPPANEIEGMNRKSLTAAGQVSANNLLPTIHRRKHQK